MEPKVGDCMTARAHVAGRTVDIRRLYKCERKEMAASASFSTPVSYQTNMMVTGPGGYAFGDFLKFGLPLQLVCMLATVPACHLLYR